MIRHEVRIAWEWDGDGWSTPVEESLARIIVSAKRACYYIDASRVVISLDGEEKRSYEANDEDRPVRQFWHMR